MADKIYIGAAVNTAEVGKINIGGTIAVGNTFTVTLGKASITYTTTTTVVADAVAGILALLQATTAREEFQAITWTSGTGYVRGTGDSDGYPWTDGLSVSKAQGSGGSNTHTISITVVTAGTGSFTWSNTENWAGGVIPVAGDTIHLGLYGIVPRYKIDRSGLGSACTLIIYSGDTSGLFIGLSEVNSGGYPEYLNRYLNINAKLIYGIGTGQYVPKLNFAMDHIGTSAQTHTIYRSETRDNNGKAPLQLKGRSSGIYRPHFDINGGNADLSLEEGETVYSNTLGNINCSGDFRVYGKWSTGPESTMQVKGFVFWGSVGVYNNYAMPQSITVLSGGVLRTGRDSNAVVTYPDIASLQINSGGTVYWNRVNVNKPIITEVKNSGSLIFSEDIRGNKQITKLVLYAGSSVVDPNSVTTADRITFEKCSLAGNSATSVDLGIDRTLKVIEATYQQYLGDSISVVYRTGLTPTTTELEMWIDGATPNNFGVYSYSNIAKEFFDHLTADGTIPGSSGTLLLITDGSTAVYVTSVAAFDTTGQPILSCNTWLYNGGAELFADSTPVTITRLS